MGNDYISQIFILATVNNAQAVPTLRASHNNLPLI